MIRKGKFVTENTTLALIPVLRNRPFRGDDTNLNPLFILPGAMGGDACPGRMEEGVRQE